MTDLLAKIRQRGRPLAEFAGVAPLSGIKTGYNEAFLIDTRAKEELIASHPLSRELLRPYLRGQDFDRWCPDWGGLWMIALSSSENKAWPWASAGDRAEEVFKSIYPAIHAHMDRYRDVLNKRQDQGRFWWELRSCAYWSEFDKPKIMYPEITWRAQWGLDAHGTLCNNTAYFLPADDSWILAVGNAPVTWWYSWRSAMHGKDEALRFIKDYVQDLPVPAPTNAQRDESDGIVLRLIEIARSQHETRHAILDWLLVQHEIAKPSLKLQDSIGLDSDAFVAEVRKARGKQRPLSAAALKSLRDEHARTIEPARRMAAEALGLEQRLSTLVNEAYGLAPEEVALLWQTAPPRMPIPPPLISGASAPSSA